MNNGSANLLIFRFRVAVRHHGHIRSVLLLGRLFHRFEWRVVAGDALVRLVPTLSRRTQGRGRRQEVYCDQQRVNTPKSTARNQPETPRAGDAPDVNCNW